MEGSGERRDGDFVTKTSPVGVAETLSRLARLLEARGLRLFATLDQAEEARRVGLDLRETTLVLFGSPAAGTPVMVSSPLSALDLPLKVALWADGEHTRISYAAPDALAARHHLTPELAAPLRGIDALTDELASRSPAGPTP